MLPGEITIVGWAAGKRRYSKLSIGTKKTGIGVPIRDLSGYPLAALSTAFVSDWLDQEKRVHCAAKLKSAAARIAARYLDRQASEL